MQNVDHAHGESADEVHQPHESGVAAAEITGPLFDEKELAEFESDDHHAGRAIGKLLAGFFLYTVIVMTIVALWTLKSLSH
jgi:hypothetical protein